MVTLVQWHLMDIERRRTKTPVHYANAEYDPCPIKLSRRWDDPQHSLHPPKVAGTSGYNIITVNAKEELYIAYNVFGV